MYVLGQCNSILIYLFSFNANIYSPLPFVVTQQPTYLFPLHHQVPTDGLVIYDEEANIPDVQMTWLYSLVSLVHHHCPHHQYHYQQEDRHEKLHDRHHDPHCY